MTEDVTLSVCLIVKNEQRMLPECLESVQEVADQIVVLDTGSTDQTVAIAEHMGAEVYAASADIYAVPPEAFHFAKARNESIRYATGDWIFWLDADERLTTPDALLDTLEPHEHPIVYNVMIKSYTHDIAAGNAHKTSSVNQRLFTNGYGIAFRNRIHEGIFDSMQEIGAEHRRDARILLDHWGYALDEATSQRKRERNLRLMEQVLDEHPDNYYMQLNVARQLSTQEQFREAIPKYRQLIRDSDLGSSLRATAHNSLAEAYIHTDQHQKAFKQIGKSFQLASRQVTGHFLLYMLYEKQEQWHQAQQALRACLHEQQYLEHHPNQISTDVEIHPPDAEKAMQYLESQMLKHVEPGKIVEQRSGTKYFIRTDGSWMRLSQEQHEALQAWKNEGITVKETQQRLEDMA